MHRLVIAALSLGLAHLGACAVTRHPTQPAALPPGEGQPVDLRTLATPGPIAHEAVVSARWSVDLAGLVDLEDPKAASLENAATPIVLPVHVLTHPSAGVFIIDTGIDRERAAGRRGAARGLVRPFLRDIDPVQPLGDIVAQHGGAVSGVLLTHLHLDHVLGLGDVPRGTPIYVGEGEASARGAGHGAMRRSFNAVLDGHAALQTWSRSEAVALGPIEAAWDVLGDGSLWALASPGHTPGSTSYLARTTDGPVLFVGDTSHTRWGWDRGVAPGRFTRDHDANRKSLAALRRLAAEIPGTRVFVGHETDGVGTGVPTKESRER